MSRSGQGYGNPLVVLGELEGLARSVHLELSPIEQESAIFGVSASRGLAMKLEEYVEQLDIADADFLEKWTKADELNRRAEQCSVEPVLKSDRRLAAYYISLQEITTEVATLYMRFCDDLTEVVKIKLASGVMSGPEQWRLIRGCSRGDQKNRIENDVKIALVREESTRSILTTDRIATLGILAAMDEYVKMSDELAKVISSTLSTLPYLDYLKTEIRRHRRHVDLKEERGEWITSDILEALVSLRDFVASILSIDPQSELTEAQQKLEEKIQQQHAILKEQKSWYYEETDNETISVDELREAVTRAGDLSSVDLEVLDSIAKSGIDGLQDDEVAQDIREVKVAYTHGAYKLATVGCAAILECLFKEALRFGNVGTCTLQANRNLAIRLMKKNRRMKEDDLNFWSFEAIIVVAETAFDWMDSGLADSCHGLRKGRNKIHGGIVEKDFALFGLKTLGDVWQHMDTMR